MERQKNLLYYSLMLCIYYSAVAETMSVSFVFTFTPLLERVLLVGGFGMSVLLMNQKDVQRGLRRSPCLLVLPVYGVFLALATCSSIVTRHMVPVYNPFTRNILLQLFIFDALSLALYSIATGRAMDMFECLFRFMVAMVVLTDLQMLVGIEYSDGMFETYFVGTKFDVVYMHMNMMALFFTRLKLRRKGKKNVRLPAILLLLALILNVIISIRVDCNTGLLGSAALVFGIYVCDRWETICRKWLCSPRLFGLIAVLSATFVSYVFWILERPIVQYIIVDKLGRSLNLTGRTDIYRMFPTVMRDHWMWGFGVGNSYPVCVREFGYTDVQNSVLQWVLQIGVPATAAMIVLFCFIISYCRRMKSPHHVMPMLVLIYVYLLLGTVEITMNSNFWLFMIILLLLSGAEIPPIQRRREAPARQANRRKGDTEEDHED